MPRINIEESFFSDVRVKALSKEIGEAPAIGVCVLMWKLAQKFWGEGHRPIPEFEWNLSGFPEQVFTFGLAKKVDGGIYVSGSQEHFEWYQKRREAAKKGGEASASRRATFGQPNVEQTSTKRQPSSSSSSSSSSSRTRTLEQEHAAFAAIVSAVGKNWRTSNARLKTIKTCLAEGLTTQDLVDIAKVKRQEWADNPEMRRHLTFETLYRASHRDKYMDQVVAAREKEKQAVELFGEAV